MLFTWLWVKPSALVMRLACIRSRATDRHACMTMMQNMIDVLANILLYVLKPLVQQANGSAMPSVGGVGVGSRCGRPPKALACGLGFAAWRKVRAGDVLPLHFSFVRAAANALPAVLAIALCQW